MSATALKVSIMPQSRLNNLVLNLVCLFSKVLHFTTEMIIAILVTTVTEDLTILKSITVATAADSASNAHAMITAGQIVAEEVLIATIETIVKAKRILL